MFTLVLFRSKIFKRRKKALPAEGAAPAEAESAPPPEEDSPPEVG